MRLKLYNIPVLVLFLLVSYTSVAQTVRLTREQYILKYKELVRKQMKLSGIPASIIMAQACLESGNGNSRLATEANNHFGIKCTSAWTGPSIRHDDDAPQECFRKYDTPEGSFADHSDFLRYRDRYAFLFDLPRNDYRAWAVGLKQAGYATNPQYAESLIKIIEDNKLYELDSEEVVVVESPAQIEKEQTEVVDIDHYTFTVGRRRYRRNGVEYVLARQNDSYENIALDVDVKEKRLRLYNDDPEGKAVLEEGDVIYIMLKKSKTVSKLPMHIAEEGETMRSIAQRYAVQLKHLYRYNKMKAGQEPVEGQEIFLNNKKARK